MLSLILVACTVFVAQAAMISNEDKDTWLRDHFSRWGNLVEGRDQSLLDDFADGFTACAPPGTEGCGSSRSPPLPLTSPSHPHTQNKQKHICIM